MQLWVGLSFFSNDAFIWPVYCSPSVRPNVGWDLNLYDDDIAGGGDIIGSHLGGFGHLQGCGQNSSKVRVSAMNYVPRKATNIGRLQKLPLSTLASYEYTHDNIWKGRSLTLYLNRGNRSNDDNQLKSYMISNNNGRSREIRQDTKQGREPARSK